MSLILDALRKAEADRQRGAVPGLHSAAPSPPAPAQRHPAAGWHGWPLLAAAAVLSAAVGAWVLMRPSAPEGRAEQPVLAATSSPAGAAPAPAPATPLPQVVSAPPPPPPAATAVAAVPPPPAPATSPPPIVTQVRRLADLPPEQRRELPPLVVSGSVWSEQAAARFVMLDGQVLREGDSLAPGLVLVKLAPRSATLRWRDGLVEVPF